MSDLTTKVLIEIRDELRGTREEIRATNVKLETTNARLDVVARRQLEGEMHVATELVAVRDSVDRLTEMYRADRSLRKDVDDLKERVANLENKAS